MPSRRGPLPRRLAALATCAVAAMAALVCAGLLAAALLVPAPAAVAPLIVIVCVGLPMAAAWQLPEAIAELRRPRLGAGPLARLRRDLDTLPETEHPLGL